MTSQLQAKTGCLDRLALHGSLRDPILDSINFLNEVMDRFPQAISFAPGAPYAGFFEGTDIAAHIERYCDYLATERKFSPEKIRKHLYQYGPSRGQINDLIAQALFTDEGIEVTGESIVVTVGCQEAILLVLRALCASKNDVVAVVNPCFAGIAGAARLLDVEILPVEETEQGFDWAKLTFDCQLLRQSGKRVTAMYVAPDFSNPSGTVLSLNARHELLAFAKHENFVVLEDNAYGFTASSDTKLPTLKALDNGRQVIYFGTCAKTCMPGVRVGFVVADQLVVDGNISLGILAHQLASLKSMVTVNTSPICQAIVGGMLLENGCSISALSAPKASFYRSNLSYLLAALDLHMRVGSEPINYISWNQPQGGFFVRMKLPVIVDLALLDYCANKYGVLWTPMSFFMVGEHKSYEIRLSCSYLDPNQIDEGVRRLARFVRDERVRGVAPEHVPTQQEIPPNAKQSVSHR
ncbi:PLP-dependent aminotransferase family protein [Collimonas fungivorans]|nr:PLP-dependent aminotransferase family protein [Collimonas fungivorans]